MYNLIPTLKQWRQDGKAIALATIIETGGSALRPAGTRMAITVDGDVSGSVSGGCVDGDTIAEMETVLKGKVALRRPQFGISDELAWQSGLACGGSLDVLIERWDPLYDLLIAEIEARHPVAFASRTASPQHLLRTAGGTTVGSLGSADLDSAVLRDISAAWPGPHAQKHTYPGGEIFIEIIPPPPTLLIFGATDIAIPLAQMARVLNYQVIVSDARRTFLQETRFPGTQTRFGWPQDVFVPPDIGVSWAIVILFHDPKLDIPALTLALKSQAFYIGMLGSRSTQAERRTTLVTHGTQASDLNRIHGPVGLNIGGREPAHIALSILSEIVAVRHRRPGGKMKEREEKKF